MTTVLPPPTVAPAAPTTCDFGFDRLRPVGIDAAAQEAFVLALGAVAAAAEGRAARVSAVIALSWLAPEGQAPLDPMRLSILDRAAALFGTAFRVGRWPAEFVARCDGCGAPNLMRVAPQEFGYRPGQARVVAPDGRRYMQPNGHHEAALMRGDRLTAAMLALDPDPAADPPAAPPSHPPAAAPVDDAGVLSLLEHAGPQVDTGLDYRCPGCGAANRFWFDPLDWIARQGRGVLLEVHRLARAYGWSEADILALPQARRRAYLALIEGGA